MPIMGRGMNLVKLPALKGGREGGGRERKREEISNKDKAEGVREKKRRREGGREETAKEDGLVIQ